MIEFSTAIGIETLQIVALMTLSQENIAMFLSYLSFDYSTQTRKACRAAKDLSGIFENFIYEP
uniref:Uncharacterized protein n=1 Tax=Cucumis sativus TaxID=3659 RepID=A0A0A0L392_CUCSA